MRLPKLLSILTLVMTMFMGTLPASAYSTGDIVTDILSGGIHYVWDQETSDWGAFAFGYALPETDAYLVFNLGGLGVSAHAQDNDYDPNSPNCGPFTDTGDALTVVGLLGKSNHLDPVHWSNGRFHNTCRVYKNNLLVEKSGAGPPPPGTQGTAVEIHFDIGAYPFGRTKKRMSVSLGEARANPAPDVSTSTTNTDLKVLINGGVEFDPIIAHWVPWSPPAAPDVNPVVEGMYTWSDPGTNTPSIRSLAQGAEADGAVDFSDNLASALNADTYTDAGSTRFYDPIDLQVAFASPVDFYDQNSQEIPWFYSITSEGIDEQGRDCADVGVNTESSQLRFSLRITGANPIRHRLDYAVEIRSRTMVTINLIDVAGHEVSRLLHQSLTAGDYHFTWHRPTSLTSGMYFLRVEGNGGSLTNKVVFLR